MIRSPKCHQLAFSLHWLITLPMGAKILDTFLHVALQEAVSFCSLL